MKPRHINEIKAIIIVAAALIIFASLISFTPLDLPFYTSHPNIPPHKVNQPTKLFFNFLKFVFYTVLSSRADSYH